MKSGNIRISFPRFYLLLIISLLALPNQLYALYNSSDEDLSIDAPWRTVRDYLPVLFFSPDFDEGPNGRKVKAIRLYNLNKETQQKTLIFSDSHDTEDDNFLCEIDFVSDMGKARSDLSKNETIVDFWHYVARVPVDCIGVGNQLGKPGVHYLRGEIEWVQLLAIGTSAPREFESTNYAVLRVVVTPDGFEKFSPIDHQYDVHIHTIAEQTSWHGTVNNLDAARKAFGGPLAMIMESAYALGLVDIQLKDGNWPAYKNKIITTDHNSFFSGNPYDSGSEPGYGPTKDTDGEEQEFLWYRNNLGVLGGEEITVQGANGKVNAFDSNNRYINPPLGSHFLAYGAQHIEGPWHGATHSAGTNSLNTISITRAISHMGLSNGFGYASHPQSDLLGWSTEYYERAIGLGVFNGASADNPIIQNSGDDFVFKGLQIWNEHADMKSESRAGLTDSEMKKFDPFTRDDSGQHFKAQENWRKSLDDTYAAYQRLLQQGLRFSFTDQKEHVFIRKLYMSAGTDAHGDFNYNTSIYATAALEALEIGEVLFEPFGVGGVTATSNAFARFRTYTLTSHRYVEAGDAVPPGCPTFPFCGGYPTEAHSYLPVKDYQEGNTVVTDGPVGRFSTDANCRFNSDRDILAWHDTLCIWENHDGIIGGRGRFDGGNTMLAPVGNQDVYVKSDWIGKNDYQDDVSGREGQMRFSFVKLNSHSELERETFTARGRSKDNIGKLNDVLKAAPAQSRFPDTSALILEGQLNGHPNETKFITNPVWIAPYRISIDAPVDCPIKRGELKVTLDFAISMDTTLPTTDDEMIRSIIRSRGGNTATYVASNRRSPLDPVLSNQDIPGAPDEAYQEEHIYQGIRVKVKPLSSLGKSGDKELQLSGPHGRWQSVELPQSSSRERIQDARYTISNLTDIDCGGGWNAIEHKADSKYASYAIVVDEINDMHKNYLNPIATTFVVKKPGLGTDPIGPIVVPPVEEIDVVERNCGNASVKLCRANGATCDVVHATNGTTSDVCRWSSKLNAQACSRTLGIWTTPASRYSRRHPDAVRSGTKGACITEVKNISGRQTSCSTSSSNVCKKNGATCEVIRATNGSTKDLCRWASKNNSQQCARTVGIWTTSRSRYSNNHPNAVRSGTAGACITESQNIKDRID